MKSWKLRNGPLVYHEPNSVDGLSAMQINIGRGSYRESAHGIAHLLEHMVCTKFKEGPRRARDFFNAFTGLDETVYHVGTLDRHFPEQSVKLIEAIFGQDFPDNLFHREVSIVQSEMLETNIGTERGPASTALFRAFFPSDLYDYNGLGTHESVGLITPDQLRAFKQEAYAPANAKVFITGNIPRPQFEALIDRLESYPALPASGIELPPIYTPTAPIKRTFTMPGPKELAYVQLAYEVPNHVMTDGTAYAIISQVLYGVEGRIQDIFRQKMGKAYSTNSERTGIGGKSAELVSVPCRNTPESISLTRDLLFAEFNKIKSEGIPQDDLMFFQEEVEIASRRRRNGSNWEIIRDMVRLDKSRVDSSEYLTSLLSVPSEEILHTARRYLPSPNSPHIEQILTFSGNGESAKPAGSPATFI